MVHYVADGDLTKTGTTLCGLPVRASMGVIATKLTEIKYVSCEECLRRLLERSSDDKESCAGDKDPCP